MGINPSGNGVTTRWSWAFLLAGSLGCGGGSADSERHLDQVDDLWIETSIVFDGRVLHSRVALSLFDAGSRGCEFTDASAHLDGVSVPLVWRSQKHSLEGCGIKFEANGADLLSEEGAGVFVISDQRSSLRIVVPELNRYREAVYEGATDGAYHLAWTPASDPLTDAGLFVSAKWPTGDDHSWKKDEVRWRDGTLSVEIPVGQQVEPNTFRISVEGAVLEVSECPERATCEALLYVNGLQARQID